MYYQTQKGTPTHEALDALYAEIAASRAAIREWMNANNVEASKSFNINLTDHPVAVTFKEGTEIPAGWKFSTKRDGYMPDNSKAGKAIARGIASLPIVGRMRITDIFNFESFYKTEGGGMVMVSSPSVHKRNDIYLIQYNPQYTGFIPDDLVEITGSQYKKLIAE